MILFTDTNKIHKCYKQWANNDMILLMQALYINMTSGNKYDTTNTNKIQKYNKH